MEYEAFGWPWPTLDRVRQSEPRGDGPGLGRSPSPDSPLRFVPLGVVAAPLAGGTLLWLVMVAPFLVVRALRRRRRIARGQCVDCGYPLRGTDTCPECGTPASVKPRVA